MVPPSGKILVRDVLQKLLPSNPHYKMIMAKSPTFSWPQHCLLQNGSIRSCLTWTLRLSRTGFLAESYKSHRTRETQA